MAQNRKKSENGKTVWFGQRGWQKGWQLRMMQGSGGPRLKLTAPKGFRHYSSRISLHTVEASFEEID